MAYWMYDIVILKDKNDFPKYDDIFLPIDYPLYSIYFSEGTGGIPGTYADVGDTFNEANLSSPDLSLFIALSKHCEVSCRDTNLSIKYMDDISLWKTLEETIERLNYVKKRSNNVICCGIKIIIYSMFSMFAKRRSATIFTSGFLSSNTF